MVTLGPLKCGFMSALGFLLEKNLTGRGKTLDHCFLKQFAIVHFVLSIVFENFRGKSRLGGRPPVAESQAVGPQK